MKKVLILKGEHADKEGELIREKDFGKWSTVFIKNIGFIYIDKTYLKEVKE